MISCDRTSCPWWDEDGCLSEECGGWDEGAYMNAPENWDRYAELNGVDSWDRYCDLNGIGEE